MDAIIALRILLRWPYGILGRLSALVTFAARRYLREENV
jgi:hypothetical protein